MKKRKIRFNIVDVIIILVLIALAFAVYRTVSGEKKAEANGAVTLRCVFRSDVIPDGLEANFRIGESVFADGGKVRLGTVSATEVRPAVHTGVNTATGDTVFSDIEGKYTVYVTVDAAAEKSDNSYYIDGLEMLVGMHFDALTPEISCGCECISIETLSE